MSRFSDNDNFIQELLLQRDELYAEVSRFRQADNGTLDNLESKNKELEHLVK